MTEHFGVPAALCVNRWDINSRMTDEIEDYCRGKGIESLGRIGAAIAVSLAAVAVVLLVYVAFAPQAAG